MERIERSDREQQNFSNRLDFDNCKIIPISAHQTTAEPNESSSQKAVSGSHWFVLTNIDSEQSNLHEEGYYKFDDFVFDNGPESNSRAWLAYDSLNSVKIENNSELRNMISMLWPPEVRGGYLTIKKVHVQKQEGDNDCGLFALAYIESLCRGHEPGLIEYDQSHMRQAYNQFVSKERGMLHFRSTDRSKENG